MSTVCASNDIPNITNCTMKDEHQTGCPGVRQNGKECTGCIPAEATHGFLCEKCWQQLSKTLERWPQFAATIIQYERTIVHDNAGIRVTASGHVNLHTTFISVNETESHLLSLTKVGGDPLKWVNRAEGAIDALHFIQAAKRANKRHPLKENVINITRTICPTCEARTLKKVPPQFFEDHAIIKCFNPKCDYEQEQAA